MALQSSGAISIGNIRTELGSSSGSLRTLSSLAGKSIPDGIGEFYGYSNAVSYAFSEAGFGDGEGCCAEGPSFGTQTLYSSSGSLAIDDMLYTGSSLSEAFDGQDQWWYSNGKSFLINSAGRINDIFSC